MQLPSVIEKVGRNLQVFDLPSKLLNERIIFIGDEINSEIANNVIVQLLWLDSVSHEPIDLYINSPGGSVFDGLAIFDIIKNIESPVNTFGIGLCASMGAFLLSCGTGERNIFKNCRFMIHTAKSGFLGNVHDARIELEVLESANKTLLQYLSEFSGLSDADLIDLTQRDKWMSPEEAKNLGFVDNII